MNSKGSYTALIALMVFILVVASSFTAITKTDSVKGQITLKVAGDVKRTFDKTRFLLDKTSSNVIAEKVIENFRTTRNCDAIGLDLTAIVQKKFDELELFIKNETGVSCDSIINGVVASDSEFEVKMVCDKTVSRSAGETTYSAKTQGVFPLKKQIQLNAGHASGCEVIVVDVHSNLVDVNKSNA